VRRLLAATALLVSLAAPTSAQASFGFLLGAEGFKVTATAEGGKEADTQAGSHPYSLITEVNLKTAGEIPGRPGVPATDGDIRDLHLEEPGGLIENAEAIPRCALAQFHTPRTSPFEASQSGESCSDASQVGVVAVHSSVGGDTTRTFGLFNLAPAPGQISALGFAPYGVPIALTPHIRQAGGEYGITLDAKGLPQSLNLYGLKITIWGNPWGTSHNGLRGNCLNEAEPSFPWAKCKVRGEHEAWAYLTLPTSCEAALSFSAIADSWQQSGAYGPEGEPDLTDPAWQKASSDQVPLGGCNQLSFSPNAKTITTTDRVSSPSGLDFSLQPGTEGLLDPQKLSTSQVRQAIVALPPGLTINPSVGAGLGVCTPQGYAAETVSSPPGAGCPNASKIGDFTVTTPLLPSRIEGSIFLAQPHNNPFGSLVTLYLVAKSSERGVLVKVAGKVDLDERTGRLTADFNGLPQIPYARLDVFFREGQRAPLVNPDSCGQYTSQIALTPWLGALGERQESSGFSLGHGIGGAPCPSGPVPFNPQAVAGTLNQNAGSYTPFHLHLTRTDAEQEITSYSATFPKGLLGKIAGIPYCPEQDIALAKQKTGTEELEHPSCPAASQIGTTYTGYGVGSVLAYAPGRLYLAGPYRGSSFSIVAVDSALVGPFDLGVITVRSAIHVDPRTAQVAVDSTGSDPIPHIVDGIPLHLRDIRVYLDRSELTINPTSCDPFQTTSTLTGSAAPFANPADALGVATVPFQVSNCSALKFKPRFGIKLKGKTRPSGFPKLIATVRPKPGQTNIGAANVTLPSSLFLAQNHIEGVCTKPKLEANHCPADSIYGHATAITPLLGVPLSGPVYLATGYGHELPELVAAIEGQGIRILLEGQIDSKNLGLRVRFSGLPDAPVSKFTMTLFGGPKKGLLQVSGSVDLCRPSQPANARFAAQDNSGVAMHPALGVACKGQKQSQSHKGKGGSR
jgi:hypothetical protein